VRLPQMMLRMHYKTVITILNTFQGTRKIKYWKYANAVLKRKKKWINIKSKNTVTRCCFQLTWSRRQIIVSINLNVIMIIYRTGGSGLYMYKVSGGGNFSYTCYSYYSSNSETLEIRVCGPGDYMFKYYKKSNFNCTEQITMYNIYLQKIILYVISL